MVANGRDPSREAFWRRTLRRHAKSGMSIAKFCETEDLTASAFYYWQREIRRRDGEAQAEKSDAASGATFVPVQLLDDRNCPTPVEIVAASGFVIRVSETATTDHLRRVLRAVSELD